MTSAAQDPSASSSGLTIGELALRTGIAAPTLRMWESRHGFPVANRLPSGHRRYDESTVEKVLQVARRRDAGVRLETAIAEIAGHPDAPVPSVYADLRRRYPQLAPHRLRKSTLLALTWALEDECCARALNPWLFGTFQQEVFYRKAESRWRDLARTARGAWAIAEFDDPSPTSAATVHEPIRVGLPHDAALTREWTLVCVARDFPAVLAAWELPGQDHLPDADRVFESLWSLDDGVVRDAARNCVRLVGELGYDAGEVTRELDRPAPPAATDLTHATVLFNRMMAYADQLS